MNDLQTERLVVAFEKIAVELGRANDTAEKAFSKRWPERREVREAIVTRIPTEEDLIKEAQGASDEPIKEWIGFREKQYIEEHPESSKTPVSETGGPESGRTETSGGNAGAVSVGTADNTTL